MAMFSESLTGDFSNCLNLKHYPEVPRNYTF